MLPIQRVLHPTDFSERSQFALQLACSLARDHRARLLIVHVAAPAAVLYGDVMAEVSNQSAVWFIPRKHPKKSQEE